MHVGGRQVAAFWFAADGLWLRDAAGTWRVRANAAQRHLWESMVSQW